MKMNYLQGEAAVIAGIEMDRAMSYFQLSGTLLPIEDIKIGPQQDRQGPTVECKVRVLFLGGDLVVEVTFEGTRILYLNSDRPLSGLFSKIQTHWKVDAIVTRYKGETMSDNTSHLC